MRRGLDYYLEAHQYFKSWLGERKRLSGHSSAMESKGESIARGVTNSVKAIETSKKIWTKKCSLDLGARRLW